MNLKNYLGKSFTASVEGSEDNGVMGFSGNLGISSEGIKLNSGLEVPFIVGSPKGKGFVYAQGLKNGRSYRLKVTQADESLGILFVRVEQRALAELRVALEDLQTRFQKMSALETIESTADGLLNEIGNYAPADQREERIIAKYLNQLVESVDLAKRKFNETHERKVLLEKWASEMKIERARPEQMPYLRTMVGSFLRRTTVKPFDFEAHLKDFDHRGDKTLVGYVNNEVVATASYNQRSGLETPGVYPDDANLIEFMGLTEFKPEFGKTFLKNIIPHTPLGKLYVVLWQHANFEFFKAMGFHEGEITNVARRNQKGKANVHRYYTFNPED